MGGDLGPDASDSSSTSTDPAAEPSMREASRPRFPERIEYGDMSGADAVCEPVTWEEADAWLTTARYYWINTCGLDGRPCARPVWGVWLETSFHFATSPRTVTARNVARNGYAVVHPESALDVVIVEGVVGRAVQPALSAAAEANERKYGWKTDTDDPGMPFYSLEVETAVAWRAKDPRGSAARWKFAPG